MTWENSASQSYTLSGAYLSPSSGNITITGSSSFEVSADNVTFSNSFSLPYSGGILSPATLYVRLKAGLSEGNYLNENITHSGGGASVFLAVSGSVDLGYLCFYSLQKVIWKISLPLLLWRVCLLDGL